MQSKTTIHSGRVVLCALLACLGSGCSNRGRSFDYLPGTGAARAALNGALKAWQNGHKPGRIDDANPCVQVVDSHWQAGERITNYEILGEIAGEGPRCFSVRLTTESEGEHEARYFVLGRQPLWVYRDEDYGRIAQWDHHGTTSQDQ